MILQPSDYHSVLADQEAQATLLTEQEDASATTSAPAVAPWGTNTQA